MFGYILLIINATLVIANTALCSLLICIVALFKMLSPTAPLKRQTTALANKIMWLWATVNAILLTLSNRPSWQITGGDDLSQKGWYLMMSNHRSWTDIVVLCCVFKDRIPMPKFFMKHQLLYIPLMGMACWAIGMPFMRRYSREYLIRHPEKRGQDLETTRRACEQFKHTPTTVVNYVEGTRYRVEKAQGSPFQHLLPPKSGGIAYTLAAMAGQFDAILDVTLAYPDNVKHPFKDMLMGRMKRIVVDIKVLPVDERVNGDYFNDKPYKRGFQKWLNQRWEEKDKQLGNWYK